eukprot:5629063-Prymnesium_polylepis.1
MRVAHGVAAGMSYLHRRGIMHRDLKSANVLIDAGGVVKLTDFGVAVQATPRPRVWWPRGAHVWWPRGAH